MSAASRAGESCRAPCTWRLCVDPRCYNIPCRCDLSRRKAAHRDRAGEVGSPNSAVASATHSLKFIPPGIKQTKRRSQTRSAESRGSLGCLFPAPAHLETESRVPGPEARPSERPGPPPPPPETRRARLHLPGRPRPADSNSELRRQKKQAPAGGQLLLRLGKKKKKKERRRSARRCNTACRVSE